MDEFFARNRLSAYLDGELSEAEMAEVARALEEQPELREAYRELQAAVELLREHGPVQAPPHFHAQVMRRVEGAGQRRGWFARLLGPLGRYPAQGLGVAVVAAAVLLLVFRGPQLEELGGSDALDAGGSAVEQPPEREAAVPGADSEPEEGAASDPAQKRSVPDQAEVQVGAADAGQSKAGEKGSGGGAKVASPSGSKEQQTKSIGVPIQEHLEKTQGTHIPDWDKEPDAPTAVLQTVEPEPSASAGSSGNMAVSPFAYRLTPTEANALFNLVVLAERLGGGAYDLGGALLEPQGLTVERNYAEVVLKIPASALTEVEPQLRKLGGVVSVRADHSRLYPEDAVHVTVEVQYLQ
jgi:hypothetical protein